MAGGVRKDNYLCSIMCKLIARVRKDQCCNGNVAHEAIMIEI